MSGTGVVAEGAIYSNTKIVLSWLTVHKSMCIYDSLAEMMAIHGHGSKTRLMWDDEPPAPKPAKRTVLDE